MSPANIRRLEHAAKHIDQVAVRLHCARDRNEFVGMLFRTADEIRLTLAPEIGEEPNQVPSGLFAGTIECQALPSSGDSLVADLAASSVGETGCCVRDDSSLADARKAAACLAAMEPFRVLGSCPAPQVDVIDGETA